MRSFSLSSIQTHRPQRLARCFDDHVLLAWSTPTRLVGAGEGAGRHAGACEERKRERQLFSLSCFFPDAAVHSLIRGRAERARASIPFPARPSRARTHTRTHTYTRTLNPGTVAGECTHLPHPRSSTMVSSPRGSRSPGPAEVATAAPIDVPDERAVGGGPTPPAGSAAATSADWQAALDAVVPCVVVLKCVGWEWGVGRERHTPSGRARSHPPPDALSRSPDLPTPARPPLSPPAHATGSPRPGPLTRRLPPPPTPPALWWTRCGASS